MTFDVIGETASGVGVIPNINYSFKFKLSSDGTLTFKGCHDSYPAYHVKIGSRVAYNFEHKPKDLIGLFGNCDVSVNKN